MIHPNAIAQFLEYEGFHKPDVDRFMEFHSKNPLLWEAYQKKAFELIKGNPKRIGSKDIFEQLRKDKEIKISGEFKANNNFTSMYARVLVFKYKALRDKIELRAVGKNIKRKHLTLIKAA